MPVTRVLPPNRYDNFNGQAGPYAPSCPGWVYAATGAVTQTRAYAARFVPRRNMLVTNIRFVVAVTASVDHTVDVGIYDSPGTTKLASSGATTGKLNSTGPKTVNLTASYQMTAGTTYYLVVRSTDPSVLGGTAAQLIGASFANAFALRMFGVTVGQIEGGFLDDSTAGLPTSIASLNTGGTFVAVLSPCES